MTRRRTLVLGACALTGFAANSLLCRAALGGRAIDPLSFTAVRILAGALVLALLARRGGGHRGAGSRAAAAALFAYALAFSCAYRTLPAGAGALLLFGAVQVTMLLWVVLRGERPGAVQVTGLVVALGGLAALTLPGAGAPAPSGAVLMVLAGVAWGAYSMLGRGVQRPLLATADNFVRCVPGAALLVAVALAAGEHPPGGRGLALAACAGAVTSGVGYAVWYAVLPHMRATSAAVVQLLVPVLAAAAALPLLGEPPTLRLLAAGPIVLAGVGLALAGRARR